MLPGGFRGRLFFLAILVAAACGDTRTVSLEEFNTRVVTLPDGFQVRAELMTHPQDMMRGMMFRKSLPEDRGMLFIHGSPGQYSYWMYQVEIPLDIIWMDRNGRVVELSPNTPPCESEASQCPSYGGTVESLYVLELAAGSIEKHGIRIGSRIRM